MFRAEYLLTVRVNNGQEQYKTHASFGLSRGSPALRFKETSAFLKAKHPSAILIHKGRNYVDSFQISKEKQFNLVFVKFFGNIRILLLLVFSTI